MALSTMLKRITGLGEAVLGIPILGGLFILANGWTPLYAMFVVHIVTLVFSVREQKNMSGSILGIVTSMLGWIPILGMIMHIITATLLLFDGFSCENKKDRANEHTVN